MPIASDELIGLQNNEKTDPTFPGPVTLNASRLFNRNSAGFATQDGYSQPNGGSSDPFHSSHIQPGILPLSDNSGADDRSTYNG